MKTYSIRRKDTLKPMTLDFEVEESDDKGKPVKRPLSFGLVAYISGKEMLDMSALLDTGLSVAVYGLFDRCIVPDDKKRWDDWLVSANGPDFEELTDLYNDVLAAYSNRQSENPTHETQTA